MALLTTQMTAQTNNNLTHGSSTGGFPARYLVALISGIAGIFLAIVVYLVWFYCRQKRSHLNWHGSSDGEDSPNTVTNDLKISQSTPDLVHQLMAENGGISHSKHGIFKHTQRQSTLPTVSERHVSFQRQLSHKLDLSNIEFTVQSIKHKEQPNLGSIKPELYKQVSIDSIKSEQMLCGKIFFSLKYEHDLGELKVLIHRAEDLPAKDFSGTSDPYVKTYLLPDRKHKCQTKVHRKTLNPEFNESFTFSVPYKEITSRTLQFNIYDFDRFSRHDLIGAVVVKDILSEGSLLKETFYVRDILSANQEKFDFGELMLSLCYLPTAGRLTLTVVKARNLKAMDITGSSDPYVKVSLMCQGKRIKKRKTSVKRNTLNPVYNEAMVFDVPQENVDDVYLVIKMIDYDRIGSNEVMGCCALGPKYNGVGRDHWFEMLESPRKPVAQWYALQEHVPCCSDTPNGKCKFGCRHSRQSTVDSSEGSTY
ncbi:synaptotagmin-9-like [Ylistrum balloti]|uniref:synaptotagmin-9-like n=1 Tax=Ylistrum balloti TaxID=509963 RepID=UPI002905B7E4|nr:synaptotagmin-9-like [Ylistrum balloti]